MANDAFQTYGLDKSASQLALAAEKCKEKKVQFFCQDATNLPLATESVEVIIGSRFFSTLTSPERQNQVFREMMRVLKK
ncbi:MAG: class I SAM-dependent methyltransferase [Candidatus Peribacteria bacterium]|nr:class I SAM-dependent methyltransferase [Candidatus Peribacteria bacterium]